MSREVGFRTGGGPSDSTDPDVRDQWDDILDGNEKILWQGRPDSKIRFDPKHIPLMLFGTVFAGFALFWMIMASFAGGFLWMFGLIHFSAGIGIIAGPFIWGPYRRARTWYTLSNKRAFIATVSKIKGRRLTSYPITKEMVFDVQENVLTSIYFANSNALSTTSGRYGSRRSVKNVKIGFEFISDGSDVLKHMRRIQRDLP